MTHGWIRIRLPALLRRLGAWHVSVGETSGAVEQLIAAAPEQQTVTLHGLLGGPVPVSACTLRFDVWVEPSRVTEIALPDFGLGRLLETSNCP